MTVRINIVGIDRTNRFLKNRNKDVSNGMQRGIKKAIFHVQNEVKLSIAGRKSEPRSVDTGKFLSSVEAQAKENEGSVFSDLEYAKYLEHGTSGRVARKHFGNTAAREKDKVKQIIKTEIKKGTII